MRLLVTQKEFLFVPGEGVAGPTMRINRETGEISRGEPEPQSASGAAVHSEFVYGVLGIAKLLGGRYLIVISKSELAATVGGHEIRRMTRANVIPFATTRNLSLTPEQLADESHYLRLLDGVLSSKGFYFAYDLDLTSSWQRLLSMSEEERRRPLHRRVDQRFHWNRYLQEELIKARMDEWVLPIVSGYFFATDTTFNGKPLTYTLFSRRSCRRAGRRYTARGLDANGNAANFVETEQAVLVQEAAGGGAPQTIVAAFVQTRGSIPTLWRQQVCIKYTPKVELYEAPNVRAALFKMHMEEQMALYGRQVLVDLVNQKGNEFHASNNYSTLCRTLAQESKGSPGLHYVAFDFHKECKGMRFENVQKLRQQLHDEFDRIGYLLASFDSTDSSKTVVVRQKQLGTFRTNCMDCLDRTNVVQSDFARYVLRQQLAQLGFDVGEKKPAFSDAQFDFLFRNVWANNADAMSVEYSGTGAQKTDYTRLGVRTKAGALRDLIFSAQRYVLNNFFDGDNQDALDLFLGNYVPDRSKPSPYQERRRPGAPRLSQFLTRIASYTLVALLLLMLLAPSLRLWAPSSLRGLVGTFAVLFPVVAFYAGTRTGTKYVNMPALCKPATKVVPAYPAGALQTMSTEAKKNE